MTAMSVPTDVKVGRAGDILGVTYALDARIPTLVLRELGKSNVLSTLLRDGTLYLTPDPYGRPIRKGRAQAVHLPAPLLKAILDQETTQDEPGAPTALSYTLIEAGLEEAVAVASASVVFTAHAGTGASSNVQYRLGAAGVWTALDPADAATPVTIPLDADFDDDVYLRHVNPTGEGPASAALAITTPAAVPTAPVVTSAIYAGGILTVVFTGAVGATNLGWRAGAVSSAQSPWVKLSPADVATPFAVTIDVGAYGDGTLSAFVGAELRLRAYNACGYTQSASPYTITAS